MKHLTKLNYLLFMLLTGNCFGSIESTLDRASRNLTGLGEKAGIIGVLVSALAFCFGSENSKRLAQNAMIGVILIFLGPSLIKWLKGTIN